MRQGVVRETMKSARTGETRTILVQRGESSRVEVRDGDGRALLEIPMGLVRTSHLTYPTRLSRCFFTHACLTVNRAYIYCTFPPLCTGGL